MANIAVIGSGYWGKNLVRVFYNLGVLKVICDTNKEVLKSMAKEYPLAKVTDDYQVVFSDKKIDAVVIASPAITHYQLVKQALDSSKHVFVEKPLALTLKEGLELKSLFKKTNKILMVGHILNYHPAIIKLKELVARGELGKIEYIYSNRLNIGKLRREENILWSFAPHDISVVLSLLGEFPVEVNSFGTSCLQEGIYDTTVTTMAFLSSVKAHIFVSWLHPFKEQKLVVVGSKKMAVFDDLTDDKLFLYPHKIDWLNRIPIAQKAEKEIVPIDKQEPLKNECQHFLDCIAKNTQPLTDIEEGLKVLRVLESCEESLKAKSKSGVNSLPGKGKYSLHSSSFVDEGSKIGDGTQIWHFSHILGGSIIGRDCKIGQNVVIGPNVKVGNSCKIQNNVSIYEGITLEDAVFCGPSCVFTNVINPRSEIPRMKEIKKTVIKKGASIGANATIVCGNNLGKYCFVGAGSVVTKDIPDYALVYGNPASVRAWVCECGVKLLFKNNRAICSGCKKEYRSSKSKIERIK